MRADRRGLLRRQSAQSQESFTPGGVRVLEQVVCALVGGFLRKHFPAFEALCREPDRPRGHHHVHRAAVVDAMARLEDP